MLKLKQLDLPTLRWSLYVNQIKSLLTSVNLLKTWVKVYELKRVLTLLYVTRKNHNYYFNLPLNNQKTRSKPPRYNKRKWKFFVYKFTVQLCGFKKVKISNNFILFDYINRLWYKQWYSEWAKIRGKRIQVRRITYKNRTNINFPILQYKHIIRNFKTVNKKKQKFLNHFNLGFFFFEYIHEGNAQLRFNKNVFKKKYSKFFLLKSRLQRHR